MLLASIHPSFTFHFGSINTDYKERFKAEYYPLHSTLVPLIRKIQYLCGFERIIFTFHFGSINTICTCADCRLEKCFTFHFGSINTLRLEHSLLSTLYFTFHFGSINTKYSIYKGLNVLSLHSTLVPLIRIARSEIYHAEDFTFHFGSINTLEARAVMEGVESLHSTLVPLIRDSICKIRTTIVSLHSTLVPLIRDGVAK